MGGLTAFLSGVANLSLERGVLEYKRRRDGHSGDVPVTDVLAFVQALRKEAGSA